MLMNAAGALYWKENLPDIKGVRYMSELLKIMMLSVELVFFSGNGGLVNVREEL